MGVDEVVGGVLVGVGVTVTVFVLTVGGCCSLLRGTQV
jgi:hypothetical protein